MEQQPSERPKNGHAAAVIKEYVIGLGVALALGATRADEQPNPDHWRVLIDPAGHPFCITTLIPDD